MSSKHKNIKKDMNFSRFDINSLKEHYGSLYEFFKNEYLNLINNDKILKKYKNDNNNDENFFQLTEQVKTNITHNPNEVMSDENDNENNNNSNKIILNYFEENILRFYYHIYPVTRIFKDLYEILDKKYYSMSIDLIIICLLFSNEITDIKKYRLHCPDHICELTKFMQPIISQGMSYSNGIDNFNINLQSIITDNFNDIPISNFSKTLIFNNKRICIFKLKPSNLKKVKVPVLKNSILETNNLKLNNKSSTELEKIGEKILNKKLLSKNNNTNINNNINELSNLTNIIDSKIEEEQKELNNNNLIQSSLTNSNYFTNSLNLNNSTNSILEYFANPFNLNNLNNSSSNNNLILSNHNNKLINKNNQYHLDLFNIELIEEKLKELEEIYEKNQSIIKELMEEKM